MSGPYDEIKAEAYEANMEIPRRGLAIYTFGNASALDPGRGAFAIKPSGVPYDELVVDELVVLDLEGRVIEGTLRPSSDAPTHAYLYRWFAGLEGGGGIRGITHTHSTYATSWAQARRAIPIYGTTHADHLAADVPCTEAMDEAGTRGDYEAETGRQIRDAFRAGGLSPIEIPMVLVAGHGPFTWGKNADKAVYHAAVLEELAKMATLTERVARGGGTAERLPAHIVKKHYERKHGDGAYYGQR